MNPAQERDAEQRDAMKDKAIGLCHDLLAKDSIGEALTETDRDVWEVAKSYLAERERSQKAEAMLQEMVRWGDAWCPSHECCAESFAPLQEKAEAILKAIPEPPKPL